MSNGYTAFDPDEGYKRGHDNGYTEGYDSGAVRGEESTHNQHMKKNKIKDADKYLSSAQECSKASVAFLIQGNYKACTNLLKFAVINMRKARKTLVK